MSRDRRFDGARIFHWLLGGLLVWASLAKLGDPQSFHGTLLAYQLPLPDVVARLIAVTLPWLELFCGLMLLVRVRVDAALLCGIGLFAVFAVVTAAAWGRGLKIDCGCLNLRLLGLAGDHPLLVHSQSVQFAFWRAVVLLAMAILLLRRELKRNPLQLKPCTDAGPATAAV